MQKLTARQQQVLTFIKEYSAANGYPPTRVDIARELGFRSPNAAEDHLKALARKGAVEMIPGACRGVRLPAEPCMTDIGIFDGDLLAVHRTSEVRNGQVVVARIDDEVTVKRFQKQGRKVSLIAENPEFAPIEIDLGEQELVIEGLSVGIIRH